MTRPEILERQRGIAQPGGVSGTLASRSALQTCRLWRLALFRRAMFNRVWRLINVTGEAGKHKGMGRRPSDWRSRDLDDSG